MVLDKEWICGKCVREKDMERSGAVVEIPKTSRGEKYFSGERWTGDEVRVHYTSIFTTKGRLHNLQKRRYFESLPPSVAVDLLLRSTVLYPTIPIFPSIPGLYDPALINSEAINSMNGLNDDDTDSSPAPDPFDDDPPAHFPKPGFGLARTLPPESEHLPFLVDENTDVFSHFFPVERAGGGATAEVAAVIAVS